MNSHDPQLFAHLIDCTHRSPLILVRVEFHSLEYIESLYEQGEVTGLGCMVTVYKVDGYNYRIGHVNTILRLGSAVCIYEKCADGDRLVVLENKLQIPSFCVKKVTRLRFDDFDFHEGYSEYRDFLSIDDNDKAALEMDMTVNKSHYPWIP